VTWQISFAHLRQNKPSAADLLSLMSCFDQQRIPEELLRCRGKQVYGDSNSKRLRVGAVDSDEEDKEAKASQSRVSDSELEDKMFEDDIVTLRNFYLISDETDGISFKMHTLVQLAIRTWLKANGELEQWQQQFVTNLRAAFPTGQYKNWAVCQKLYVHAKMAATQKLKAKSSLLE
jgi:hypothetical protein